MPEDWVRIHLIWNILTMLSTVIRIFLLSKTPVRSNQVVYSKFTSIRVTCKLSVGVHFLHLGVVFGAYRRFRSQFLVIGKKASEKLRVVYNHLSWSSFRLDIKLWINLRYCNASRTRLCNCFQDESHLLSYHIFHSMSGLPNEGLEL